MKKFIVFLMSVATVVTSVEVTAQDTADTRIFTPAEMQRDFNYLRRALEDTHPGLYIHHTKEEMQYKMDSLYHGLNKPMPFFDFYKIIAYLIAEVQCEHTYCQPYSNYNKRLLQWKLIPMQLFFTNHKAYVTVNRTSDTSIHLGDEVLSINHYPVDSIKEVIYRYIPSDAGIESAKENMVSTMAFNLYYYLFIERPEAFDMVFKNPAGHTLARHYDKALGIVENDRITLANLANREILNLDRQEKVRRKTPWRIELIKDKNTAIISLLTFGGERKELFKLYDKFFTTLQKEKVGNVIINLAHNDGGDEEYACELLSYLLIAPTRFITNEYLINDDTAYLKLSNLPPDVMGNLHAFIDTIRDGKIYAKPLTKYSMELKDFTPKANGFHGNVYFYVNGGTASAASTCAANAQSHGLATIVGNETGGCFAGGGSSNGLDLVLPNSKITAHTSILYCEFSTSGKDKHRGVIPDYYYIPSFDDLVHGNKGWKEFIYGLIEAKR